MKSFIGFVIKEFYHIFRDRRTLLILFAMPILQMLLFGYVITNEVKDAKIAIFDKSKDNVTRKITNKIASSGYFQINAYIENEKDIARVFKEGTIREVVVFESQFAEKLGKNGTAHINIIADAS